MINIYFEAKEAAKDAAAEEAAKQDAEAKAGKLNTKQKLLTTVVSPFDCFSYFRSFSKMFKSN